MGKKLSYKEAYERLNASVTQVREYRLSDVQRIASPEVPTMASWGAHKRAITAASPKMAQSIRELLDHQRMIEREIEKE